MKFESIVSDSSLRLQQLFSAVLFFRHHKYYFSKVDGTRTDNHIRAILMILIAPGKDIDFQCCL